MSYNTATKSHVTYSKFKLTKIHAPKICFRFAEFNKSSALFRISHQTFLKIAKTQSFRSLQEETNSNTKKFCHATCQETHHFLKYFIFPV